MSLTIENLSKLGFKNLRYSGENIMMSCPFHEDNSPSFGINTETGKWNCFSCGRSGKDIKSLSNILNIPELLKLFNYTDSSEILNKIENLLNPEIKIKNFDESIDYLVPYYKLNYTHEYLNSRGISKSVTEAFNIGYDPIQKAIAIPVYDIRNTLKGFTYRYLFNPNLRYKHEVDKGNVLFGEQFIKKGTITIVEGNMDVLKAYSLGLKNVVALMGTKMTAYHEKTLLKYADEIILALDNDYNKHINWGKIATENIGERLIKNGFTNIKVFNYPKNIKDIGEMNTIKMSTTDFIEWRLVKCI